MENSEKYFYAWKEFDRDIKKIAKWARGEDFTNIYGIPRGGLVVAVVLSHHLDLPVVLTISEISDKTLVVDDISDSGSTLAKLESKISAKPKVATLFFHKDTKRIPDFYIHQKTGWVVFPWETEGTSKYDATHA